MLTSAIVTLAQKQFPDWSRTMILEFLNELQRIVYTQNTVLPMRMYDSTTGKDPILTTVSNTYSYDINTINGFPYDAWKICNVYKEDISESEDVTLFDSTPNESAKVVFKENPSSKYYVRCYKLPTQLTSETIQLSIPHGYHLSHVYEGLCGLIEKFRSGKSDRWDVFEKLLLPELVKKLSDNKETTLFSTQRGY